MNVNLIVLLLFFFNPSQQDVSDILKKESEMYKIQVAAYYGNPASEKTIHFFESIGNLLIEKGADGYIRYRIGPFNSREDAKATILLARQKGIHDAFIIPPRYGIVVEQKKIFPENEERKVSKPDLPVPPKPISVFAENISGYQVQIGVYKNPVEGKVRAIFESLGIFSEIRGKDGNIRYKLGPFKNSDEAVKIRNLARDKGIKDAFLVVLNQPLPSTALENNGLKKDEEPTTSILRKETTSSLTSKSVAIKPDTTSSQMERKISKTTKTDGIKKNFTQQQDESKNEPSEKLYSTKSNSVSDNVIKDQTIKLPSSSEKKEINKNIIVEKKQLTDSNKTIKNFKTVKTEEKNQTDVALNISNKEKDISHPSSASSKSIYSVPDEPVSVTTSSKSSSNYSMHIVKLGENLASIAKRYDMTENELMESNDLSSNKIKPSEVLKVRENLNNVPDAKPTNEKVISSSKNFSENIAENIVRSTLAKNKKNYSIHIVKKGEQLSDIAKQYSMAEKEIIDLNELTSDVLEVDLLLKVQNKIQREGGPSLVTVQPVSREKINLSDTSHVLILPPVKLETGPPRKPSSLPVHIVKPGEKLSDIAKLYGMTEVELMELNQLSSRTIKPRQVLLLKSNSRKNLQIKEKKK